MNILEKGDIEGVQIQIKPLRNGKGSRSFTLHNADVDEVYNRIVFLFEQLSNSEGDIRIIHYKKPKEVV